MSSSLELKSDTSTFSPSETLVSETHSRPEAKMWASPERSRFRPDFNTLTRLKEGWRGPRFLFLASFATWMTSSQHLAKKKAEKKQKLWLKGFTKKRINKHTSSITLSLDQYSQLLTGVSDQQWPTWTLFQVLSTCWGCLNFSLVDRQKDDHHTVSVVYWCRHMWRLIFRSNGNKMPLTWTLNSMNKHLVL